MPSKVSKALWQSAEFTRVSKSFEGILILVPQKVLKAFDPSAPKSFEGI
jgi:hypothetical protein